MLGHKNRLLWMLLAVLAASVLWMLKVEITYQRNIKHIPADFRERPHDVVYLWKV